MKNTHKVVCSFGGETYSRHRSLAAAEKAAKRLRRRLSTPNCGTLAAHVQVVTIDAEFGRIVPAENEYGVCAVSQARWTDWTTDPVTSPR